MRVLPSMESLRLCEEANILRSHIWAMQGPFSKELNAVLLRQFQISYLVTKDGGQEGGFLNKVQAAQETETTVICIQRPVEQGQNFSTILQECEEMVCR